MHEYAITVVGKDRPGIIAEVSAALAGLGCNLTDSTMTLLRGHFAMTLICSAQAGAEQVDAALASLTVDPALVATVRELTGTVSDAGSAEHGEAARHCVLSLHGADRLGIVAAAARVVADAGGNITDLTTRLGGGLYALVAEVDFPSTVDIDRVSSTLRDVAASLGVEVSLRQAETDVL